MTYNKLPIEEWRALVDSLTGDEFLNLSPFVRLNCADCKHLKAALSLWCTSEDAKKARGTSIPGVSNCSYWQPDWSRIPEKYMTEENGWIYEQEKTFWDRLNHFFNNPA